jgi:hypothetical protein
MQLARATSPRVFRLAARAAGLLLLPARLALAQGPGAEGMSEVPIYVTVEAPEPKPGALPLSGGADTVKTLPGVAVRIHGVADQALAGKQLEIVVTPPQEPEDGADPEAEEECAEPQTPAKLVGSTGKLGPEPPVRLSALVQPSGTFEVSYTPQAYGEHEVEVTGEAGQSGETGFEVVEPPEAESECTAPLRPKLEPEARELAENVTELADAVCDKQEDLPASPAVDEARAKCEAFEKALAEAVPPGTSPLWVHAVDHLADLRRLGPEMRTVTAGLVSQLEGWEQTASEANQKFEGALASVTHGNVVCDQIDIIINGLKFCDFYLSMVTTPGKFFVDWAKENGPTKLVSMIPAARRTPATQQAIESAWKGMVTFKPSPGKITGAALANAGGAEKFEAGFEFARGAQTMLFDLSQFVANRFFEKYCQQFQGPVSGTMAAEFYHEGQVWWRYTIEISGQLTLRYPKDAAGDAIALTGEFTGNAMKFRSWDDIRVKFPEARGSIFKSLRREPLTLGDMAVMGDSKLSGTKIAGQEVPSFNPLTSTLDKGGPIVKGLLTPAFFRIPVRGDLRGDNLRLEVQPAVMDFKDPHVKVTSVLFSVLSLRPHIVKYTLPYKDAHWIITGAMDARTSPVDFKVARTGATMTLERKFHADKPNAATRGVYDLSVKACNPSC